MLMTNSYICIRHDFMRMLTRHNLSHDMPFIVIVAVICLLSVISPAYPQDTRVLFREDFNTLENWRPLYFPKIPRHSTYTVETNGSESFLKAESNTSASALIFKQEFNIYDYPKVRWRWKISNVYHDADPEKKSGDDYPIRVHIMFKYDPRTANTIDKVKYGIVRGLYGEYPPRSTLNYVWANGMEQKAIITSPYTDKAKLIALEKGKRKVGMWQDEEANIIQDYRGAFGADPPSIASIAIMNDSDNTGQQSVSYIDFIEVFKGDK
jgi:hypothetical protein